MTPTSSAASSGPTNQQLLALTHAIALQESGSGGKPNYAAVGDNGTSHGAYQWQPGNFEAAAKDAGLDPNDRSPMNQDKVAYFQVKGMADKGLSPAQIASTWNSGQPNNFQNHSGTTVINGKPISYDTPAYVRGVQAHYQQLLGQSPKPASPAAPVPTASSAPIVPDPNDGSHTGLIGNLGIGATKGAENLILNTAGGVNSVLDQTLGRVGNAIAGKGFVPTDNGAKTAALKTALNVAPSNAAQDVGAGIYDASGFAAAPELDVGKLAEAAPTIAKVGNAALRVGLGAVKDATIGTAETGDPVQGALIGVGGGALRTAGEGVGAAAGAIGKLRANPSGIVEDALRTTANKYTSSQRMLAEMEGKSGTNPLSVIASYGNKAVPQTEAVGKINPTEAIDFLHGKIADLSGLKNEAVFNSSHTVTVPEFRKYTADTIDAQPWSAGKKAQALAESNRYFDNLDTVYKGKPLPLAEVDKIKTEQAGLSNAYSNPKTPFDYDTHGVIGKAARSLVELHADDAPTKELNKLIQSHYDAAKLLDTLRGKTPHGGALGLALSKLGGEVAGSVAGSTVGHPFLGAMAGRLVGGQVDDLLNSNLISNPLKRMIINSYKGEAPEVVARMQQYLDANAPDIAELGDHTLSARPMSSAKTTAPIIPNSQSIPNDNSPMTPFRQSNGGKPPKH